MATRACSTTCSLHVHISVGAIEKAGVSALFWGPLTLIHEPILTLRAEQLWDESDQNFPFFSGNPTFAQSRPHCNAPFPVARSRYVRLVCGFQLHAAYLVQHIRDSQVSTGRSLGVLA